MTGPTRPQQGPYSPPAGPPSFGEPPHGQQPPYAQQPPPPGAYPMPPGGQPVQAYGQQPGEYPPPGGQPPPYGQQPAQFGEHPPPAGKPSRKRKWISVLVSALVLIGGTIAVAVFNRDSPNNAEAGDCIKVNSASTTSADVEKIDCADPIAVFKVAKRLGNDTDECPSPDYEKYTQTGRGSDFALCLMLNAKEGDCFTNFDSPGERARADCAAAEFKVGKMVTGQSDPQACDPESAPVVYPEPATTFCLTKP